MFKKIKWLLFAIFIFLLMPGFYAQNLVTFIPPKTIVKPDTVFTIIDVKTNYKKFIIIDTSKIVQQEGYLLSGKKTGRWVMYYPTGEFLSLTEYDKDVKNGLYVECEKNGALIVRENYKNGKLDGVQRKYFIPVNVSSSIVKSLHKYKSGDFNTGIPEFNDSTYVKSEFEYKEGKKNGSSKWYFMNRAIAMEQTYENDILNGTQRVFNQQGVLLSSGNYSNDKKNGVWTEYYDSGKIKSVGKYINDIQCGEWKYYDEQGKVTSTKKFEC